MAKAAFLLPYPEMCEMLQPMLSEFRQVTPACVEYVHTEEVEARAQQLEREGCDLLVARGLQAMLIQRCTTLPLVQIRITSQELGVLILNLRKTIRREPPVLALIGFANMFPDTSHFDELFGIHLRRYMVNSEEELVSCAEQAFREGCDGLIGGEIVCSAAQRLGMPAQFLSAGTESLHNALVLAAHTANAIDLEKRSNAATNLMFNNTHSGLLQLNQDGVILRANARAFLLLRKKPKELLQHTVQELFPKAEQRELEILLGRSQETFVTLLDSRHSLVISSAQLGIDGNTDSILLTIEEGQRVMELESELRRELLQRGFIAKYTFAGITPQSKETMELHALAKRMARLDAPILLSGEIGTGKRIMAQCIHNESLRAGNAFVLLDCSAWQADTLDTMLFGNFTSRKDGAACLAELARDGTLYLSHIETLPYEIQFKLLNLIRGRFQHNGSNQPQLTNVRVIAATSVNLISYVEKGTFRSDLYYALNVLTLRLSPLRRRREDILGWVDRYLNECQQKHKRYVSLTNGARHYLEEYDWPGNLDQVHSVCERIVLLAQKRNIDEAFLRRQLDEVAPKLLPGTDSVVMYKDVKAVQLSELLRKYNGNRKKVAEELGVSKTTLWRYMKKYGIESDFSC